MFSGSTSSYVLWFTSCELAICQRQSPYITYFLLNVYKKNWVWPKTELRLAAGGGGCALLQCLGCEDLNAAWTHGAQAKTHLPARVDRGTAAWASFSYRGGGFHNKAVVKLAVNVNNFRQRRRLPIVTSPMCVTAAWEQQTFTQRS